MSLREGDGGGLGLGGLGLAGAAGQSCRGHANKGCSFCFFWGPMSLMGRGV